MEQRQLGKYRLLKRIGAGGMAEVFLAKSGTIAGFEKTVALKCILPHFVEDPESIEAFLNEARVAARLTHSNIVQIYDLGESEGTYFIAMEHIDGPSARALWERAQQQHVPIPCGVAVRIIADACQGLAFAHEYSESGKPLRLVHRDVNPENILLSRAGTVKIADFGIARSTARSRLTQVGVIKGKLWYMPLEQLLDQPLDCRTDVYALGITLYELLTGRLPYDAEDATQAVQVITEQAPVPAHEVRRDLPRELWPIVVRAMAPQKEKRYRDCRAFNLDLERFLVSREEVVGAAEVEQFIVSLEAPAARPARPGPAEGDRAQTKVDPAHSQKQLEEHRREARRRPPPAPAPAPATPRKPKPPPAPAPAPPDSSPGQVLASTRRIAPIKKRSPLRVALLAFASVLALGALGASAWRWRAAAANPGEEPVAAAVDDEGDAGIASRPDASVRVIKPRPHRDGGVAKKP